MQTERCGAYTGKAPLDRLNKARRQSYKCNRPAVRDGRCERHFIACGQDGCDRLALVSHLDGAKTCPAHRQLGRAS